MPAIRATQSGTSSTRRITSGQASSTTDGDHQAVVELATPVAPSLVVFPDSQAGLERFCVRYHAEGAVQGEFDGRIHTADSWPELLNKLTDDWFQAHSEAVAPGRRPAQINAERNSDRHTFNSLAQQRLANAELISRTQAHTTGETTFHTGDRVVAQAPNRDLRPNGGQRSDHVINGSVGTVTGFTGTVERPNVILDFESLGTAIVPHSWVATDLGSGRGGGIAPAHAVTSFKAEGQTYDVAFGLVDPTAAAFTDIGITSMAIDPTQESRTARCQRCCATSPSTMSRERTPDH